MTAKLLSAWGYQGDAMNLACVDVEAAVPYYVSMMGFAVIERSHHPVTDATPPRAGGEPNALRQARRAGA